MPSLPIIDNSRLNFFIKHNLLKNYFVTFTNGVFDILHLGHLKFFERLKELEQDCFRRRALNTGTNKVYKELRMGLIFVGLNSDESVKRIKGPTRPFNTLEERAEFLNIITNGRFELVSFDEDTPLELIKKIKPDLLVKGGGYSDSDIIGSDFVKSYGGIVRSLPMYKDKSSTSLERKVLTSILSSPYAKHSEWNGAPFLDMEVVNQLCPLQAEQPHKSSDCEMHLPFV